MYQLEFGGLTIPKQEFWKKMNDFFDLPYFWNSFRFFLQKERSFTIETQDFYIHSSVCTRTFTYRDIMQHLQKFHNFIQKTIIKWRNILFKEWLYFRDSIISTLHHKKRFVRGEIADRVFSRTRAWRDTSGIELDHACVRKMTKQDGVRAGARRTEATRSN